MKKSFSTLSTVALIAAMSFAFSGCGTKEEAPAETTAAVETEAAETEAAETDAAETETAETEAAETETAETEAAETETAETETAATEEAAEASALEAWVESDEMQAAIQALASSQTDMNVDLYAADANTAVFSFTFAEQIPLDSDEDKELIVSVFEDQMAAQETVFKQMREQLVTETGMEDAVVRIEYLNADGSVIYSVDYTK